jgi:hypothetical protein
MIVGEICFMLLSYSKTIFLLRFELRVRSHIIYLISVFLFLQSFKIHM